jgi:hypothetical protein
MRRLAWLLFGALAQSAAALAQSFDATNGQPSAFPNPSYISPSSSNVAPSSTSIAPNPSYGGPSPSFAAPSPSFATPSPSFAAPSPSYVAPSASSVGPGQSIGSLGGSPVFGSSITANPAPGLTSGATPGQSPLIDPALDNAWMNPWLAPAVRPGIYVTVETLILHRDNASIDQTIVQNSYTGATVSTTRDLGFTNWAPGGRITAGYRFASGNAVEVTWIGFQDWNASADVAKSGSLSAPAALGVYSYDFSQANSFHIGYNSQLQNIEVNWLAPVGRVTLLAGFRYLSWNEFFDITGTSSYQNAPESSDYSIATYNNLYGAQIGARMQGDWKRLHWDMTDKVGLFGNEFWQRSLIQDLGNTAVYEDNWLSHAGVAFVGDLSLNVGFRLTDFLMLRAGYNLIWIDGLALAPNQLDFNLAANSGTAHNHEGSVLLQGVSAGLEARW